MRLGFYQFRHAIPLYSAFGQLVVCFDDLAGQIFDDADSEVREFVRFEEFDHCHFLGLAKRVGMNGMIVCRFDFVRTGNPVFLFFGQRDTDYSVIVAIDSNIDAVVSVESLFHRR